MPACVACGGRNCGKRTPELGSHASDLFTPTLSAVPVLASRCTKMLFGICLRLTARKLLLHSREAEPDSTRRGNMSNRIASG